MKIYSEFVSLQSKKPREILEITSWLKAAVEKSGLREGMALISSQHLDTALIVTEHATGLLGDLESWLDGIAPLPGGYAPQDQAESKATVRLGNLLLPHQTVVPFTESRLDLGTGQAVLFIELDGLRPRRITPKIIGE